MPPTLIFHQCARDKSYLRQYLIVNSSIFRKYSKDADNLLEWHWLIVPPLDSRFALAGFLFSWCNAYTCYLRSSPLFLRPHFSYSFMNRAISLTFVSDYKYCGWKTFMLWKFSIFQMGTSLYSQNSWSDPSKKWLTRSLIQNRFDLCLLFRKVN